MIRCILLLCAQGVVRDAESNIMSAFNIIEGIQTASLPILVQRMDVLAVTQREADDPSTATFTFRLVNGETELLNTPLNADFQGRLRHRATVHVNGLIVPAPGSLRLVLELEGTELGTYEMPIEQPAPSVATREEPSGADVNV